MYFETIFCLVLNFQSSVPIEFMAIDRQFNSKKYIKFISSKYITTRKWIGVEGNFKKGECVLLLLLLASREKTPKEELLIIYRVELVIRDLSLNGR